MKKYVLVGASSRGYQMYAKPMVERFREEAKLVGIFDINRTRAEYVRDHTDPSVTVYTDFDVMIRETRPDAAIITTIDRYHHEYAVRALESGCDAIIEKPMAIDEAKCNAILEAEKRTGRKVTVTFNCRFMPYMARIKELLKEGAVGKILSVDFEEYLDTVHGAEYFRRWHSIRENSGGLLLHKSSHHFDLVNWWVDDEPDMVFANGTTLFYGPTRENRGKNCRTCKFFDSCEFAVNYEKNELINGMYFMAEKEDGYIRDRCVFSDVIDIEDTMSVTVRYRQGALLTYSLLAYSPYEGWNISITGTHGRLEAEEYYSGQDASAPLYNIKLFNNRGELVTYSFSKYDGDHGGGDARLLKMLFKGGMADPLGQFADSYDGAKSSMIGICANKSIREKRPFHVKDFLKRP